MTRAKRASGVSVVVTCYNYGNYVVGCLESVLAQTYQDFEIVVVDDGSTDDSAEQIASVRDGRIRYVRQENSGQAVAKNRGVRASTREFIAFLDADDRWTPEKLELQLPLFAEEQVGVVYSRQSYIDHNDEQFDVDVRRETLVPRQGVVTDHLFMDNFVPFSSTVVRAQCFDKLGGFDESIAMGIDWDLWLRISTEFEFAYVDEPLLIYRIGHAGQMSKNAPTRHECSDYIMSKFMNDYPDLVSPALYERAMAFTWCNRGSYYANKDLARSLGFYLRAFRLRPLDSALYASVSRALARRYVKPLVRRYKRATGNNS